MLCGAPQPLNWKQPPVKLVPNRENAALPPGVAEVAGHPTLLLSRLGGYPDRSGYFSNRIENDM
jgi:hypothetical protein